MPRNSLASAFVHIATPNNTKLNWTYINHEELNNHPEAMIFVTQNWLEDDQRVYNPHPIGVWYDISVKKWTIFNEDREPMPDRAAFNVWILPTNVSSSGTIQPASSNSTNSNVPHSTSIISNVTVSSAPRRFFRKVLFYLIFILPVIWLIGDIFFYMQQNMNTTNWENMFMLRDNLLVSIGLLLLVIILYWMSIEHHWSKLLKWFGRSDPLDYPMQTAFFLFLAYFATLLFMAFLFPHMTGYTFKSDWALLLVVTIPVIALIALMLIKKYPSLKVEGGGFRFEFSGIMMASEADQNQTIKLDMTLATATIDYELNQLEAMKTPPEAHILVVQIDNKSPIETNMLRKYVKKVSGMAPIFYIVFVSKANSYLGLITTKKFNDNLSANTQIPQFLTETDLIQLGMDTLYLKMSEDPLAILEAYRRMVEDNILGIPVLDERLKFLGVMERSKIEQAVITQLLEKSTPLSKVEKEKQSKVS